VSSCSASTVSGIGSTPLPPHLGDPVRRPNQGALGTLEFAQYPNLTTARPFLPVRHSVAAHAAVRARFAVVSRLKQ
jgi:hypothetical protein